MGLDEAGVASDGVNHANRCATRFLRVQGGILPSPRKVLPPLKIF